MRPDKALNISVEYKLPSEVENLRKQQVKAVEAWGIAHTQLAIDRDKLQRAERDESIAMHEAARNGKKDPRNAEHIQELKRTIEYSVILEEEASKKANLAAIEFREAIREHKNEMLSLAADQYEEALNEFVQRNEELRTGYELAHAKYKRAAMDAKQIAAIVTGETDLVQLIGLTDGRLEMPKFERYGERGIARLRGHINPVEETF